MTKRLLSYGTLAFLVAVSMFVGWAIHTPMRARQQQDACDCACGDDTQNALPKPNAREPKP